MPKLRNTIKDSLFNCASIDEFSQFCLYNRTKKSKDLTFERECVND